jgi:prophage regulatory protein
MRLLRLPDVCAMTGLPRATVYAWARLERFPRPIKIGQRSSAWRLDQIERWIEERTKASRPEQAAAAP